MLVPVLAPQWDSRCVQSDCRVGRVKGLVVLRVAQQCRGREAGHYSLSGAGLGASLRGFRL